MSDIAIRWGSVDDAHDVAVVHVDAWRAAYRGLLPDQLLDELSVDSRAKSWTSWLTRSLKGMPTDGEDGPSHRLLVAHDAGEVLGWAPFGAGRDLGDEGRGELAGLYVHPDRWRRGVGAALLHRVVQELRASGSEECYLWVLAGNVRALTFYERHEWRADGREKIITGSEGRKITELRYSR